MPDPKIIQAEIEIDAPPDDVFDILTDLDRYAEWNPFTPRIDSTLELGAPVDMRVRLFEGRRLLRQVEYVTVVNRPTQLCWGANIPLRSLVRADRCQTLEPLPGDRTRYICSDQFSGWLTPIVMRYFGPAVKRGFEDCAFALKQHAEIKRRNRVQR
jgi:hypothetical protein